MFRDEHRLSKDIDIFVPDPQYLGFLPPRLSNTAAELTDDYTELPGAFVKLQLTRAKWTSLRRRICSTKPEKPGRFSAAP